MQQVNEKKSSVLKEVFTYLISIIGLCITFSLPIRLVSEIIQPALFKRDTFFFYPTGNTWTLIGSNLTVLAILGFMAVKYKVIPAKWGRKSRIAARVLLVLALLMVAHGICSYCYIYGYGDPFTGNYGIVTQRGFLDRPTPHDWSEIRSATLFITRVAVNKGRFSSVMVFFINYEFKLQNQMVIKFRERLATESFDELLAVHDFKTVILPNGFKNEEDELRKRYAWYRSNYKLCQAKFQEWKKKHPEEYQKLHHHKKPTSP
jgi:hypothetical protein